MYCGADQMPTRIFIISHHLKTLSHFLQIAKKNVLLATATQKRRRNDEAYDGSYALAGESSLF